MPRLLASVLFGALLSGVMSFLVSGISTARVVPMDVEFPRAWMTAWGYSWAVACPTAIVMAPIVRRMVDRLVGD